MCEASGNLISGKPNNAVNIVFAVDFVNHALNICKEAEIPSTADLYRPLVYNAFNPTIRDAANFLCKQLDMEIMAEFHYIFENRQLNRKTFDNYVAFVVNQYLGSGFDAERLLIVCVKIAKMALLWSHCRCNEIMEAPPLVMQHILNILDNCNMSSGGWEQLNSVATNYARLYVDKPPDSSVSVYESGSVSNHSESNFSEVSTQETASYSKASTSKVTSTRNDEPKLQFPCVPSTSAQSSTKSRLVFNFDVPSSSGESKPPGVQRDIGSPGSIPMDGAVEYDSDVLEDSLEAVPSRANFRCYQPAKKIPASSISSSDTCPLLLLALAAVERPYIGSNNSSASNPACHENLNAPSSANSGGTNSSMSPDHEPSPKNKQF